MSFSDFWEAEILDHVFDIGAYTAPTIYVGLSTADPLDDASGLAEPADTYVRVACAAWSRVGNEVDNDATVEFPEAAGAWGTVTHFALFDALAAGNLLCSAALDAERAIILGITPRFTAGELNITL
ncbi:MAG: hypothetical protein IMZ70_06065, partial [Candidatus Atribacteria bacterium]|nr:hypothetical protein [Candidatus Atribacteria bacterium]